MVPYFFFMSYARLDEIEKKHYLKKLFDRITGEVARNAGGYESDENRKRVGFFDQKSVESGDRWTEQIAEALRTAKVLVCVFSRSFFRSEACGKEVHAFLKRVECLAKSANATTTPPLIVPILWDRPERLPKPLPNVLGQIQYAHDDYGETYMKEGLEYIVRLRKNADYERFLIRFADRVSEIGGKSDLPPLGKCLTLAELENAFLARNDSASSKKGPGSVWLVFLSTSSPDWRPWGASGPSAAEAARAAVEREGLEPLTVPVDNDLPAQFRSAADTNTIVAIVVDPLTATAVNAASILAQAAEAASDNCAVIVAGETVRETSAGKSSTPSFGEEFAAVTPRLKHVAGMARTADEFSRSLSASLGEIRGLFTQRATVFRPVGGPDNRAVPAVTGPGRGAPR